MLFLRRMPGLALFSFNLRLTVIRLRLFFVYLKMRCVHRGWEWNVKRKWVWCTKFFVDDTVSFISFSPLKLHSRSGELVIHVQSIRPIYPWYNRNSAEKKKRSPRDRIDTDQNPPLSIPTTNNRIPIYYLPFLVLFDCLMGRNNFLFLLLNILESLRVWIFRRFTHDPSSYM